VTLGGHQRLRMLPPQFFVFGERREVFRERRVGAVPLGTMAPLRLELGLALLELEVGRHGRQAQAHAVDTDIETPSRARSW
jgi:hypothetical protein